jgi:hypothetical protein
VLCQSIVLNQGQLTGLVYLENDLVSGAFTPERKQLLALLSGQIAISIKNAELVEHLEEKVRERTAQLELRTQFIEQTFGPYMSNEIAESLLRSPEALDFGGHKRTEDRRNLREGCRTIVGKRVVCAALYGPSPPKPATISSAFDRQRTHNSQRRVVKRKRSFRDTIYSVVLIGERLHLLCEFLPRYSDDVGCLTRA